jgi:hypothetical protein
MILTRWRRLYAGGRWLFQRLFSTGVSDAVDIVLFWNARRAVSAVLPVMAALLLVPGWMIAAVLDYEQHSKQSDNLSVFLALFVVSVALALVVTAFATWRCPACGHNPGGHPWGEAVRKCAKCGARLRFQ